jgi:hypothetical protein
MGGARGMPVMTRSRHLVPWPVVKGHPYPLTQPRQFDILRAGGPPGVGRFMRDATSSRFSVARRFGR